MITSVKSNASRLYYEIQDTIREQSGKHFSALCVREGPFNEPVTVVANLGATSRSGQFNVLKVGINKQGFPPLYGNATSRNAAKGASLYVARETSQVVSALSSGSRPGYLRNENPIPFAISLPHRTYSRFVNQF